MRDREHERRAPAPQPRRPEPPRPLDGVLALQRSAGNRAVAAALARRPAPADAKAKTATGKATLTGIGTIEILSFGWDAGGRGGRQEPETQATFTSLVGRHSAKLQKALLDGIAMDVDVEIGGLKCKLVRALVVQYSTSPGEGEPTEQWSLAAETVLFGDAAGGGGGGGPQSDTGPGA